MSSSSHIFRKFLATLNCPVLAFPLCLAALALGLFLLPKSLVADEVDQAALSQKLELVRQKTELEQKHLEEIRRKEKGLELELQQITAELKSMVDDRDALNQKVGKLTTEAAALNVSVRRIESEIADAKIGIRQRTVAVYKLYRRTAGLDYLVNSESATDLFRRAHYLGKIAESDQARLIRLADLAQDFEKEKSNLEQVKSVQKAELEHVEQVLVSLEKKRFDQGKVIGEVKDQEKQQQLSLQKLARAAADLERLLGAVMGSQEPPKVPKAESDGTGFVGQGLAALKGRLPLPLKAFLVQGFGEHRHDEFSDILFSKGLELAARVGMTVTAIASGRVIFDQSLPGYGNVVIIDHGERYYSLYGRIERALLAVGDVVRQGQGIAVTGPADPKGSNFYFELRIRGKAVDPTGYFKEKLSAVKKVAG